MKIQVCTDFVERDSVKELSPSSMRGREELR